MEYPSDEYLVKLVKILQLTQSISLTMALDPSQSMMRQLPLTIIVQSFQQQLNDYRRSLPSHLSDDREFNPSFPSFTNLSLCISI